MQIVLQLGPSIQTQMWTAECRAVHQQCLIVLLSATMTLAVLQWTGSLVSQSVVSVGFMAAGPEEQEGAMLEYSISALTDHTSATVGLPHHMLFHLPYFREYIPTVVAYNFLQGKWMPSGLYKGAECTNCILHDLFTMSSMYWPYTWYNFNKKLSSAGGLA